MLRRLALAAMVASAVVAPAQATEVSPECAEVGLNLAMSSLFQLHTADRRYGSRVSVAFVLELITESGIEAQNRIGTEVCRKNLAAVRADTLQFMRKWP